MKILRCLLIGFCILLINNIQVQAKMPDDTIIHACGSIDNKVYTNSLEVLQNTLNSDRPIKMIELDFMYTSDKKLVCLHRWSDIGEKKAITQKKFLKKKIQGYHTMTAKQAVKLLIQYDNTYLIVDTKESDSIKVYKDINKICKALGKQGKNFRKRIIPQLYKKEDYKALKTVYPYKHWIYSTYKQKQTSKTYREIAKFCKKNKIECVAISQQKINNQIIAIFQKKNLIIATFTVNNENKADNLRKKGIDIIYTDLLY